MRPLNITGCKVVVIAALAVWLSATEASALSVACNENPKKEDVGEKAAFQFELRNGDFTGLEKALKAYAAKEKLSYLTLEYREPSANRPLQLLKNIPVLDFLVETSRRDNKVRASVFLTGCSFEKVNWQPEWARFVRSISAYRK